jgi:2-methylisocitrate lyase-like PEP mutase family enzyme
MDSQEQRARGKRFRSLHAGPDLLLLPNAWDPGSAVLMEKSGFQAIATTSSGIAFAQGLPDGERIGRARMLEVVAAIAERVTIPVSADLETGSASRPEPDARARQSSGESSARASSVPSARSTSRPRTWSMVLP